MCIGFANLCPFSQIKTTLVVSSLMYFAAVPVLLPIFEPESSYSHPRFICVCQSCWQLVGLKLGIQASSITIEYLHVEPPYRARPFLSFRNRGRI
jgi:hypothetical protein